MLKRKLNPLYGTHPVALAVEPQRKEALVRAEKDAKTIVEQVKVKLKEGGWDRAVTAPYPRSDIGCLAFQTKLGFYKLVRRVTKEKPAEDGIYRSRCMNDPDPCVMDSAGIAKFIKEAIDNADLAYTAFINKLVNKIGDCEDASLTGSHVWSYSILQVYKRDGIENWKTQQIVNCSKLGTLFNQWPSRQVK